jgi:integrase
MKLMALTFVRTSELAGGRWSEIDFEARRWNIPAKRMHMKTPQIVPLSTQAIEILGLLRSITGGGNLLIPRPQADEQQHHPGIAQAHGIWRCDDGHGFRGLASTIFHEQEYAHDHIELQLAHTPRNTVSAAYNHALYLSQRFKMMQEWADFLEPTKSRMPEAFCCRNCMHSECVSSGMRGLQT